MHSKINFSSCNRGEFNIFAYLILLNKYINNYAKSAITLAKRASALIIFFSSLTFGRKECQESVCVLFTVGCGLFHRVIMLVKIKHTK